MRFSGIAITVSIKKYILECQWFVTKCINSFHKLVPVPWNCSLSQIQWDIFVQGSISDMKVHSFQYWNRWYIGNDCALRLNYERGLQFYVFIESGSKVMEHWILSKSTYLDFSCMEQNILFINFILFKTWSFYSHKSPLSTIDRLFSGVLP